MVFDDGPPLPSTNNSIPLRCRAFSNFSNFLNDCERQILNVSKLKACIASKLVGTFLRVPVGLSKLSGSRALLRKKSGKFEAPTLGKALRQHARRTQNRFVDRNVVCGGPTFLRLASDHRR